MKKSHMIPSVLAGALLFAGAACGSDDGSGSGATSTVAAAADPTTVVQDTTTSEASSAPCPDNSLQVYPVSYKWLQSGGVEIQVLFENRCDLPQRPVEGRIGAKYQLSDGSMIDLTTPTMFVFDGSSGGNAVPLIDPQGTRSWFLTYDRINVGMDFGFDRPELDESKIGIGFDVKATTES